MPQTNDGVFRLPPLIPTSSSPSSNSNSINSHHRIGYWKADSQTPISSNVLPAAEAQRHRYTAWQVRLIWSFLEYSYKKFKFNLEIKLSFCKLNYRIYFFLSSNQSRPGKYGNMQFGRWPCCWYV